MAQEANVAKTPKKEQVDLKELTQPMIDLIERRLTLPGGTLEVEIGAAMATKFGKYYNQITLVSKKDINNEVERKRTERLEKEQLKAKYKEEMDHYTKLAKAYIEKTYGDPIKDQSGVIVGYGEDLRIEKLNNRHIRKNY